MHNKQSSKSLLVRIQVAATWKRKADDNATKTLVFSLLVPVICFLKQSPIPPTSHKLQVRRKKGCFA